MATTRLSYKIPLKQYTVKIGGFDINPDSNKAVVVLVSSFTCKLGDWAFDYSTKIYEIKMMDELINARVSFSIENIEGKIV
jgi:hypothetical protein